jgi:hypothetical protein
MHGIGEHHSFIVIETVEQTFITVDKSLLFRGITAFSAESESSGIGGFPKPLR